MSERSLLTRHRNNPTTGTDMALPQALKTNNSTGAARVSVAKAIKPIFWACLLFSQQYANIRKENPSKPGFLRLKFSSKKRMTHTHGLPKVAGSDLSIHPGSAHQQESPAEQSPEVWILKKKSESNRIWDWALSKKNTLRKFQKKCAPYTSNYNYISSLNTYTLSKYDITYINI